MRARFWEERERCARAMEGRGQQQISTQQRRRQQDVDSCGCLCCRGMTKRDEEIGEERRPAKAFWRRRRMGADEEERRIATREIEGTLNGNDAEPRPDHLVILVNGIIGSAKDWRFAAQRMRIRLGHNVAIHCSVNNSSLKTFHGVDVMGKRLASEVREVIDRTPSATRISFLAHSLGGLVSRYAIAELYQSPTSQNQDPGEDAMNRDNNATGRELWQATIGGLRPENFITLATPHLGCRGAEQLPFLLGIQVLEKTAPSLAHWFVGRTGKHLFLTDAIGKELPLLRKMVTDCQEGPFMSSLGAFSRRTLYANVINDHMVGWRTSSIRLKSEKPDTLRKPVDPKYPHVIREEEPVPPLGEDLTIGILRSEGKRGEDLLEEEMVAALTQLAWHRVDVCFRGQKGSYQAHNLIQVKNSKLHYAGADVIEHVIDKQFMADRLDEQLNV